MRLALYSASFDSAPLIHLRSWTRIAHSAPASSCSIVPDPDSKSVTAETRSLLEAAILVHWLTGEVIFVLSGSIVAQGDEGWVPEQSPCRSLHSRPNAPQNSPGRKLYLITSNSRRSKEISLGHLLAM